jgi:uncharacterized protein YdhG (YjbR/CyaY superfamily)
MDPATQIKALNKYLAGLPPDARATLEKLRKTIRAAAPRATEGMSYGLPTFRHHGLLVACGAFKNHCSFFPMSGTLIDKLADELEGYVTSKGTIRFEIGKSLPAALVRKIVKARISQNEAKAAAKSARPARRSRGEGGSTRHASAGPSERQSSRHQ